MVVAVMVMMSAGVQAQDAISKFFSKYQNDDTFSQVTISSKMFSLFTNMELENKDDQEVLNAISKLKGLRILNKDTYDSRLLYKEAMGMIPAKEFEELMTVQDKDKNMKFLIKESDGKINELVMVMHDKEEFMIMSLYGEIDLKQVSKLGKKLNVDGLENLENLKDKKNSKDN